MIKTRKKISKKIDQKLKVEFFLILSIFTLSISVYNLYSFFNKQKIIQQNSPQVLGTNLALEEERDHWKQIVSENPNYLPGWLQLAKTEAKLGNFGQTIKAYQKAIEINPNSPELLKFEEELDNLEQP